MLKKDLVIFATKLTDKIPNPSKAKENHESLYKENKKNQKH